LKKIEYIAGGLLGVEKVKPDPLNLLANTDVGSMWINKIPAGFSRNFLFIKSLNHT
jgi:hypothetical protein